MAMRFSSVTFVAASMVALVACGGQSAGRNPIGPDAGGSPASLAGTWNGTLSDSSGSMMGSGMSASMMAQMTWQITQSGNTFAGTMQFPGYAGHGAMKISGTIDGSTVTFTMTMPAGMMPGMMTGTCTATATGTLDINELMSQMHGAYAGSNTCSGPFDQGRLSLSR
jgi:hypothetical protein